MVLSHSSNSPPKGLDFGIVFHRHRPALGIRLLDRRISLLLLHREPVSISLLLPLLLLHRELTSISLLLLTLLLPQLLQHRKLMIISLLLLHRELTRSRI